jgi:hypothetical protein
MRGARPGLECETENKGSTQRVARRGARQHAVGNIRAEKKNFTILMLGEQQQARGDLE